MNRLQRMMPWAPALLLSLTASAADPLVIESAWIRSAPPNAAAVAGYATLRNEGKETVTIRSLSAQGFAETSLHQSVLVGDVSRMQVVPELSIGPGESVVMEPGGMHVMLMRPKAVPQRGDLVSISFQLGDKRRVNASFVVRDSADDKSDHSHHGHAGHDHAH